VLLVVVGCCWLLLVVVDCCWLLLVVVGCCWLLLVVVGCCWLVVGWLLLGCFIYCCLLLYICLLLVDWLDDSVVVVVVVFVFLWDLLLLLRHPLCSDILFLFFYSCPFLLSPNRLFVAGGTDPNIERRLGMWHESATRDCGHVQRVVGHHLFFEVRQILLLNHVATAPCTIDTSKYRIKTPIKITKRQAWNILGRVTHTINISCLHL
jgi:hypothetical protein